MTAYCNAECNPGNCWTAHAMHFDGSLEPAFCSRQQKPTRAERAMHALRNAMTRAKGKPTPEAKERTLKAGMTTAQLWLDGTHPLIHKGTVCDPPPL